MPIETNNVELTIVMPCLNEAETLEICIEKASNFLKEAKIKGEVLVSDNGSTDGSQEIAINNGAVLIQAKEKGYGAALQEGIKNAKGRYVIMGDADDSYDFSNLMPFVNELRDGCDLVGNRFKRGIKRESCLFFTDILGIRYYHLSEGYFFGLRLRTFTVV